MATVKKSRRLTQAQFSELATLLLQSDWDAKQIKRVRMVLELGRGVTHVAKDTGVSRMTTNRQVAAAYKIFMDSFVPPGYVTFSVIAPEVLTKQWKNELDNYEADYSPRE